MPVPTGLNHIAMSAPRGTLSVALRNGAVPNEVTIRVGDQEQRVTLQPGEERPVTMPGASHDGAFVATIRTSAGFRPSDVDPQSRDDRFLGVFVVMPEHAAR